eukprot:gnl/TRDRNA2_/TRDRNA2_60304_c0_seq1.p1 gnl/TRDRNA2_/TRDRNA2_60304_c0~~gnl/TRDRNA2_/TRDRNA2_60304_c0_seq1.p1  ORF type:complete len:687 (-),score=230.43 gnl/TRDRNA2_/TRDRNA2_60304_c0_seq1:59-2119(-)
MAPLARVVFVFAFAAYASASIDQDKGVSGVQKVIQMLQDMLAKAKTEKRDERVAFAKFQEWCVHGKKELQRQVVEDGETIELLSAEIQKLITDVRDLGEEIMTLNSDMAKYEADKKAHEKQREKDHEEYVTVSTDYAESVDAIEKSILQMQQKMENPASALLQVQQQLPKNAKAMLDAFMGLMDDENEETKSPAGGGSVIDMLKKLQDEFREKKNEADKEEMNSRHACEMAVQSLTASISTAKEDAEAKSVAKERKAERAGQAKKELTATTLTHEENKKTLSNMDVECTQKAASFEEKQKLRTEEIEALNKAIQCLTSDDMASGTQHMSLAQRKATSLAQVFRGGDTSISEGIRRKIREFLESEASRLHSKNLNLLASKLTSDPFVKVRKLVQDMIDRLLSEAHADAEHEGFCGHEMAESKITRDKLATEVDSLNAAVEDGKANIVQLSQDSARLQAEVSELQASIKEATDLRTSEKAKNQAVIADATAAQAASEKAFAVLKEFYEKALSATALVQVARPTMGSEEWKALANPDYPPVEKGHQKGQQTFGDLYTGQQDAAGGVLALLEVIISDFANLQQNTMTSEREAEFSYEQFMKEATKNQKAKERKIQTNSQDQVAAQSKLTDDTADLKSTEDQVLAANRYFDKLKPQCLDTGMTFSERQKRREEEIASLKEAREILDGEAIA